MPARLSKDMIASRNSAHAVTGSFLSSKMVPVAGARVVPQAAQRQRRTPLRSWPYICILPDPHLGHESRLQASGNAASRSPPCLWSQSYCSLCHPITSSWPGVREGSSAPSQGVLDAEGACHLSCMGVVVLAAVIGGGARDYRITRASPPTIAFSCDG
jgi:hypothetical protein